MPMQAGEIFAGYRIERLLGSGGMGEVYLAEHPRLPRHDAIKMLPTDVSADPEYRARFNREADLASKLWHPHIVSVHDRGEHDGQLWISMDFVDGFDAARLLADRFATGMPTDEAVRIITAVASALDYAHKRGLLHRDVKPANIMLTHVDDDDDEQRILLTDFGIARSIGDISGLTATNMTMGTVAYSAPEQLMGEELDGRADQYALAATAYHLLTGRQLFPHSNPAVVIGQHLSASPPELAGPHSELAVLDPVLAVGLAKDPGDRFPRCGDFARALAEQSSSRTVAATAAATARAPVPGLVGLPRSQTEQPPAPPSQPTPSKSRHPWLITSAVTAVIILAGIAMLVWHPWREHQPASAPVSSAPPLTVSATNSLSAPAPQSQSGQTASAVPVALPNVPPPNSGCQGVVIAHSDVEHPNLGTVRIFLFLNTSAPGTESDGCILPVTRAGQVLTAVPIDGKDKLGFANPATDATGNTFVIYDPGRYDGVLVLIPNADGFEDIGWEDKSGTHYMGNHAYYYAELIGPDSSDTYTIRQSHNDCVPGCADGTVTSKDLHWNGSDYVS